MVDLLKILVVLSEGGELGFYGRQVDGEWLFIISMNESTLKLILEEDPIRSESKWFGSLQECLDACVYPWNCMHPAHVHPDFSKEIYKLKIDRDKKQGEYKYVTDKWVRECGISPPQ